mmetsp:Transcript_36184/g.72603  ORF Transcript_36184/g.72603 Transcript_36184/m.72603 type:complete len:246 (-) Transcript_36184:31-768(-)
MARRQLVVLVKVVGAVGPVVARLFGPVAHVVDVLELAAHGAGHLLLAHLRLHLVVMEPDLALLHLIPRHLEQISHLVVHVLVRCPRCRLEVPPVVIPLIIVVALVLKLTGALKDHFVLLVQHRIPCAESWSDPLAAECGEGRLVILAVLLLLLLLLILLSVLLLTLFMQRGSMYTLPHSLGVRCHCSRKLLRVRQQLSKRANVLLERGLSMLDLLESSLACTIRDMDYDHGSRQQSERTDKQPWY